MKLKTKGGGSGLIVVNSKNDVLSAVTVNNKPTVEEYTIAPESLEAEDFVIKASTDALSSIGISSGDELVFLNIHDPVSGDVCFVEFQNRRLLRRVIKLGNDSYLLENDNESRFALAKQVKVRGILNYIIKRVPHGEKKAI